MCRTTMVIVTAAAILACGGPPDTPADAARAQAGLAADSAQAELWQEAAAGELGAPIEELRVDSAAVRRLAVPQVPDRPAATQQQELPAAVDAAVIVQSAPSLTEPYSGPVQVRSAQAEGLVLDIGREATLDLQIRVGGRAVQAQAGETGQLYLRQGEPFARDDVLGLRLKNDDVIYALVGRDEPVRFGIGSHGMRVAQSGEPSGNVMPVSVSVAGETRMLRPGEQVTFERARLTVKLLASVAVQGEAANALPGRPYRVELIGWRATGQ